MTKQHNDPELTVVAPVYNESEILDAFYEEVSKVLHDAGISYEILLVDDGSVDDSWAKMSQIRQADERVSLLKLSRNFGHQLAITAGMDYAAGQSVVIMDADLQDPPSVVPRMVERWREGYDVVYGVRTERAGETLFKKATAAMYYRILRTLTRADIPADAGDFRLLSRRAIDTMKRLPERHRYVRGLTAWVGYPQIGVEYERKARAAGETKFSVRKMMRFAADGILSFSSLPLRLATLLGLSVAALCIAYIVYAIYLKLALGVTLAGWTSLIVAVLFVGSVQLICLGILGSYLSRVYDEVKGRPIYVAQEHLSSSSGLSET